jgi:hypothetical protein
MTIIFPSMQALLRDNPQAAAHFRFKMDARSRPSYQKQVIQPVRDAIEKMRATDPERATAALECLVRSDFELLKDGDQSRQSWEWLLAAKEIVGLLPSGTIAARAGVIEPERLAPPTPPTAAATAPEIVERRRIQNGRNDARFRSSLHESGHLVAMLQAGFHDNINSVEIFDSPRNGTLAHVLCSWRGLTDGTKARVLAAGGAATSLLFASVCGAAADMEELRGISLTVGDVDTGSAFWELSENDTMRELRKSVERDLESDRPFLLVLADEIYARSTLDGNTIRLAWQRYKDKECWCNASLFA